MQAVVTALRVPKATDASFCLEKCESWSASYFNLLNNSDVFELISHYEMGLLNYDGISLHRIPWLDFFRCLFESCAQVCMRCHSNLLTNRVTLANEIANTAHSCNDLNQSFWLLIYLQVIFMISSLVYRCHRKWVLPELLFKTLICLLYSQIRVFLGHFAKVLVDAPE